jgi:hypothetical protein
MRLAKGLGVGAVLLGAAGVMAVVGGFALHGFMGMLGLHDSIKYPIMCSYLCEPGETLVAEEVRYGAGSYYTSGIRYEIVNEDTGESRSIATRHVDVPFIAALGGLSGAIVFLLGLWLAITPSREGEIVADESENIRLTGGRTPLRIEYPSGREETVTVRERGSLEDDGIVLQERADFSNKSIVLEADLRLHYPYELRINDDSIDFQVQ